MRPSKLAIVAAASALWALLPATARAETGASAAPIYLPVLVRPPLREPCGPPGTDHCATALNQAWQLVCGGFGSVRDLVVPSPAAPGAPAIALAVGDGASRLLLDILPAADQPVIMRWEPQLGVELTGLNALTYELETLTGGIQGWAAGDRDRIATLRSGCWRMEDAHHESGVTLTSIHADAPNGGWAVGQREQEDADGRLQTVGVLRGLVNPPAGPPFWARYAGLPRPPPLLDVYYTYLSSTRSAEAWALGAEEDEGVFLHGLPLPGGGWSWREVVRRPGRPQELTLRSQGAEGWSFGEGRLAGRSGVTAWRYARGGQLWEQDNTFFYPERTVVDVYSVSDVGTERLWVGLSPQGTQPVLARLLVDARRWEHLGAPPDDLPMSAGGGSRAIGPLSNSAALYAWGDAVWLFRGATPTPPARPDASATPGDRASATPSPTAHATPAADAGAAAGMAGTWTLLRRSRALRAFVPGPMEGGWAIADTAGGSAVISFRDQAFHEQALSQSRLYAMTLDGTAAWAVGQGGTTLRLTDGRIHAQDPGQAAGAEILAVTATDAGTLWAAGVGRDGFGRLWQQDPATSGWVERGKTARRGALSAVAALADGRAWAVGEACQGISILPGGSARATSPCTGNTDPVDLAAVAATAPDAAWAGGSYYAYRWDGQRWTVMRSESGGTALDFLANGERLTHLAALPPDDVWGVYRAAGPRDREASTTIRLRAGRWRRETLFNVPISDLRLTAAPDGGRTVWLAGRGSTVARRTYAAAEP